MRDHQLFAVTYTQRISVGTWVSEDTFDHHGWSEPNEFTEYYVASSEEIAMAHWNYWARFRGSKENPLHFVKVTKLTNDVHLILEIKS